MSDNRNFTASARHSLLLFTFYKERRDTKAFRRVISKYLDFEMNTKTFDFHNKEAFQKMIAKLSNPDQNYQNFVKVLAKHHLEVKAVIQDILECKDSMETLNQLNEKGRMKLAALREELENVELYSKDVNDPKYVAELESQRQQLASLLREFKEANITSMFTVEKAQRKELLRKVDVSESEVRNRKQTKVDRDGLMKMSSGVTEQLLSISRQLADTTQKSQNTLDSLVQSSSAVHGTQSELENTAGTITQSSKLLKKYGRREFTDKVIMFFAFLFFLAVCLYIVQKRLF